MPRHRRRDADGRAGRARGRAPGRRAPSASTYADGVADIDLAALLAGHTAGRPGGDDDGRAARAAVRRRRARRRRPRHRLSREAALAALGQRRLPLPASRRRCSGSGRTTCSSATRSTGLAADGQLRAFRHEGFWDCMDTYKDAVLLNDLWERGEAPAPLVSARYGGARRRPPRLRHRAPTGMLGAWLSARAARARRGGHRPAPRRAARQRAGRSTGTEARCTVVHGDLHRRGARSSARSASTRSTRSSTSPRRRSSAPRTARRARPSSPTCAGRGRCSRPAGVHGVQRVVVAASDKAYGASDVLPYTEDMPLRRALPLRRVEGRGRPDRALLLAHVRAAGRGDAVRQHLRRRRSQPLAADPRGRRRRARGPRAGRPLRRLARSATSSTSRTRSAPTSRSPTLLDAGAAGGEAFNAGGGRAAQRARRRRARLRGGRRRRRAGRSRHGHAGRRDRSPVGGSVQARARSPAGSRRSASTRACGARSTGTAPTRAPRRGLSARLPAPFRRLRLTHGRTFQVGGDQAQEGDRRRARGASCSPSSRARSRSPPRRAAATSRATPSLALRRAEGEGRLDAQGQHRARDREGHRRRRRRRARSRRSSTRATARAASRCSSRR